MKSNKQKRAELKVRKEANREAAALAAKRAAEQRRRDEFAAAIARGDVIVNPAKLAPSSSYSTPEFVLRGTYRAVPFVCKSCGKDEVWKPGQQKWWYEIAQGDRFSGPKFCRPCRAKERARRAEARRVHLEGVARKAAEKK